mmetsp:Transcript_30732/g.89187  ORF Transcript_30732/g.89187 Transcript_30732/m.89187 type:complete len:330 (+) Transcript_30732:1-990(+)
MGATPGMGGNMMGMGGGMMGMPGMMGMGAMGAVPGMMGAMGMGGMGAMPTAAPTCSGGKGGYGADPKGPGQPDIIDAEKQRILDEKRCASRDEAEDFAKNNRLDESAQAIFLKEPPDIQANVIDRGSLAECKNPSAALMGRLRDARQNRFKPVGGNRGTGDTPTLGYGGNTSIAHDVEVFIEQNKVDMGAARALRAEPPEIQQGVMDRGTLDGFQNPSALVMARIKDVKAVRHEAMSRGNTPGEKTGSGGSSGQLTRELTREELRKFVEQRKAGKGGTTSASLLNQGRRHADRSRSRSRGRRDRDRDRDRSRSRRRSRSRSRSRKGGRW